jgi:kynurenine 3-monooxygenase
MCLRNDQVHGTKSDIRLDQAASGRSINLALSVRGIEALKAAGVMDQIEPLLIPMRARYIHASDGTTNTQDYGIFGEVFWN